MVMGPTHAMSGAAVWLLAAPAVASSTGNGGIDPVALGVGAAVCAGSALLPDIDSPQSTVARSFGPLTILLAHVVSAASLAVRNLTATTSDGHTEDGHRTVTHTLIGAIAAGAGVSALVAAFGQTATIAVLFFTLGLAIRGLLGDWAKREGWIGVTLASLAGAWMAAEYLSDGRLWWLGAAVTAGMILHNLGDALTKEGVPFLAPFPINGKGWWEFNTGFLAFRAGGMVEYGLVAPLLTIAAALGALNVIDPTLFDAVVSPFAAVLA